MPPSVSNGKAEPDKNRDPIHVIRNGAIAASVWKRRTPSGFEYLDFSLSRSWKLKNGEREGYSQNFLENNADAIVDVVRKACEFIRGCTADQLGEQQAPPSVAAGDGDTASLRASTRPLTRPSATLSPHAGRGKDDAPAQSEAHE